MSSASSALAEPDLLFERIKAVFTAICAYRMLSDADAPGATDQLFAISSAWEALKADSVFAKCVLLLNKTLAEAPLTLVDDATTHQIRSFTEAMDCIFNKPTACHRDRANVASQAIIKLWTFLGKPPAELTAILVQAQKARAAAK